MLQLHLIWIVAVRPIFFLISILVSFSIAVPKTSLILIVLSRLILFDPLLYEHYPALIVFYLWFWSPNRTVYHIAFVVDVGNHVPGILFVDVRQMPEQINYSW